MPQLQGSDQRVCVGRVLPVGSSWVSLGSRGDQEPIRARRPPVDKEPFWGSSGFLVSEDAAVEVLRIDVTEEQA